MTMRSKTILQDAFVGAIIGFVFLHPISMVIISHTMPESMAGMQTGVLNALMEALMAHHSAMGLYFTLLGASFGFLSGFFRAKILSQNEELQKQKIVIEETLEEKDTLLRILSHDLSNQLFAGSGCAELLADSKNLDASDREMLMDIQAALGRAEILIDFSKTLIAIESGKIAIKPVHLEIQKTISEFLPTFEMAMKKKDLSFAMEFDELPVIVLAEPTIFCHTILGNILSNAVKFSNRHETIIISCHALDDNAIIAIENRGPGIPEEKRPGLFSIRMKTTTLGTDGERGTGLGMPLVYKFVKLMGGEIRVSSRPNKTLNSADVYTTVFILTFPRII